MAIKSAVYTRCGNKALYTGRSMGLYTPEESCCESDDGPIYIKPDKTDPCCVANVLQIGTEADWAEVETTTVPLEGQIIVYTDESENLLGIKIGDGNSTLNNLPLQEFTDSDEFADLKKIVEENKATVDEQIGDFSNLETTAKTDLVSAINEANSGVRSFNGRTGKIAPASGDYTATMVGAVANTRNAVVTTLGFYTSSNDASTAIQSGYYTLAYGASNAPSPHRNTSPMFVHAASNGVITQIVFEAIDSAIYKRGSKDKGSTWSDWQAFTAGSGSASSVNIIAPLEVETAANANSLSIAIGNGAVARGIRTDADGNPIDMPSIAIGNGVVSANNSVAIDPFEYSDDDPYMIGDIAVALGSKASASAEGAVALGGGASASAEGAVALGGGASASAEGAVALGYAITEGKSAIGIGAATICSDDAIAIGNNAVISLSGHESVGAVAIGAGATVGNYAKNSIAFGAGATVGNYANSVVLGAGSTADADDVISVGSVGNERRITNVATPVGEADAATKIYTDAIGNYILMLSGLKTSPMFYSGSGNIVTILGVYHTNGIWTDNMLKEAVVKGWITSDEYKTITGSEYTA